MNIKLRASLLGEQSAENDSVLLLGNYIETAEYRSVLETRDSTVIVGRRGTGKSAMFLKLNDFWGSQKGNHVIKISPDDYQTIGFRGLFKRFEGKYSHVRAAAKIVWKYGFLMEIISYLNGNYKLKAEFSKFPVSLEHSRSWSSNTSDFFSKLVKKTSPHIKTSEDNESVIGSLNATLQIPELEKELSKLLELSDIKFFVLVDRLDEGYENDEAGAAIISGVIALVSDFNKRYESIRPLLFQRDNIIRSVAKFDPDYTRNIEGEI